MKKRGKRKSGRKAEGGSASKVLERIRNHSLATNADSFPLELLDDVRWMVDSGLEKRVWNLLEEDLPEESCEALVFALRIAASRLTLLGIPDSLANDGEIEEPQPVVLIPFAILLSATFLAGEAAQFPTELHDATGRAVQSGLILRALDLSDDVTLFLDPRLYQPHHDEWLRPSATRRYLKSIAAQLGRPATPVAPLSNDYRRQLRHGADDLLADEVDVCQRLICGGIITELGEGGEALAEAGVLLFGDPDNEYVVEEDRFQEFTRLIEDELAGRCRMTQFTVMVNPTPIELWDVPRFVFQVQRSVSLGLAIEMALEEFREMEQAGRELKSALYVSLHSSEETVQEIRYAAYLVDDDDAEEEAPFFSYAWEIAIELEAPDDIDEATGNIAAQLNASVNMVEGLLPDERCHHCGAKLFCGPGGKLYHELDDPDPCPPPFEN